MTTVISTDPADTRHATSAVRVTRIEDGPVAQLDLVAEAAELRRRARWKTHGHEAKTLVKQDELRVVLIAVRAGTRLHEHKTDHLISVQALSGHVRLSLPGRVVELRTGQLLILDKAIPHDVVAEEDSALLLSIAWRSAEPSRALGFDALHGEHARFHKLLGLLEEQLDRFQRGERPDYDLMHEIFYYLTQYSDRFHHAIEDRAYAKLAERVPEAAADVAKLARQHEQIARSGTLFLANLDAALEGAILSRSAVETPARRYVELYREHMLLEESRLLPLGRAHLLPADWAAIRAAVELEADPLFGTATHETFRALQRRLTRDAKSSPP